MIQALAEINEGAILQLMCIGERLERGHLSPKDAAAAIVKATSQLRDNYRKKLDIKDDVLIADVGEGK